ncbi:ATP-binding protein [Pedobacter glucosidilyticus]|uniref:ATP-binding protein n=1 Tax=Pedobacter glucosidilyticus TaxID=1122941 RepID=UPI000405D586|nr:ATP-binding protein [Pedobacter glucosidilyticus]
MRRIMLEKLKQHLPKKEFTILTGARQTGKSTLLKELEKYCKEEGMAVTFLNFEFKTILADLDENPLNLLNYLPQSEGKNVVLIDEVQYLKDPTNFLKLIYDEYAADIKIVATGSSAFYMDSRFEDSLAGRKKIFTLLTCSFDEYLTLLGKDDLLAEKSRIIQNTNAKSLKITQLKTEWDNYMIYGGYPAVITETDVNEKVARLRELRDSFVKRDILEAGVQNEAVFYQLFRLIAAQVGSLINVNELSTTLKVRSETVTHYLQVMQKYFHISLVKPFYRNLRKELVKMPKAYLLDTGLRNCLVNNFQSVQMRLDKGELWENMNFKLLAEQYNFDELKFWRTADGNEVDFVLPEADIPAAIEVKFDEAQIKPNKYQKFRDAYPEIDFRFSWYNAFNEGFFRRI